MNSFLRRLKYYGIGFGFGLLFVFFFFQNRGCSWLPSNRVKNGILDRVLVVPEHEMDRLNHIGIEKNDIISILNDGSVDFSESIKKGNPKVYSVNKEIKGKSITVYFTLPEESFLSEVHFSEKSAQKVRNTVSGNGFILRFPIDNDLIFIDSTKALLEAQKELKIVRSNQLLRYMKQSGSVDFSKTNYLSKPKTEHFIVFDDEKGLKIGARAIWYKNKINVVDLEILEKDTVN